MSIITSRDNPKIKSLRGLLHRRPRDRAQLFLVEGWRLVREAMARNACIEGIVFADEHCGEEERRLLAQFRSERWAVTSEIMGTLVAGHGRPGVIGVVSQAWEQLYQIVPTGHSCWLAIKDIRHPGSLGTVLRTCDAAGVDGVLLLDDCVDPYDPTSVNASHGAVFSQRLARASFAELRAWAQLHGCTMLGTSPAGTRICHEGLDRRPMVIVMGGQDGLDSSELACCDQVVGLPMFGRCDSHHVAVAAGIVLYQLLDGQHVGAKD